MNRSDSLVELTKALAKAQATLEGAKKDSENPFHHSKYADLFSVWAACRKPLTDNGLAVAQTCDFQEGIPLVVETTLLHVSGEWITSRLVIRPVKDDPQAIGSAITYARRYSLAAMVGVCPEDDDAELATGRGGAAKAKDAPPATPAEAPEGEHWCPIHNVRFFKRGKMKSWAHPDGDGWCNEREVAKYTIIEPEGEGAESGAQTEDVPAGPLLGLKPPRQDVAGPVQHPEAQHGMCEVHNIPLRQGQKGLYCPMPVDGPDGHKIPCAGKAVQGGQPPLG